MIVSAGGVETFTNVLPIGIGLIESSINLTRAILFNRPDFIIFLGTAGSYGEFKIGEMVHSNSASNIELSFLDKNSYTPIDNVITQNSKVIVNSSNYITTSKKHSETFLKLGIGLENMEFFSVIRVAKEFNIRAKGIFFVTNYCDENAHKEYFKNYQMAIKSLQSVVYENSIA